MVWKIRHRRPKIYRWRNPPNFLPLVKPFLPRGPSAVHCTRMAPFEAPSFIAAGLSLSSKTREQGSSLSRAKASLDERAAQVLQWLLADEKLLPIAQISRYDEPLSSLARRFATSENVASRAYKKLAIHLEYRQRHKIDELAQLSARKVFNDNLHAQSTYNKMLPHGLLGRDYGGRPILYKHCGHANFSQLDKAGADLATALRYNEWLTERLAHHMGHVGQWTVIIDLKGATFAVVASVKWMLYVQSLSSHDALHYPDRLWRLYIINVPSFFSGIWYHVQKWLNEDVRRSAQLLSGEDQWRPKLAEIMDTSLLPKHMKGQISLSLAGICPTTITPPAAKAGNQLLPEGREAAKIFRNRGTAAAPRAELEEAPAASVSISQAADAHCASVATTTAEPSVMPQHEIIAMKAREARRAREERQEAEQAKRAAAQSDEGVKPTDTPAAEAVTRVSKTQSALLDNITPHLSEDVYDSLTQHAASTKLLLEPSQRPGDLTPAPWAVTQAAPTAASPSRAPHVQPVATAANPGKATEQFTLKLPAIQYGLRRVERILSSSQPSSGRAIPLQPPLTLDSSGASQSSSRVGKGHSFFSIQYRCTLPISSFLLHICVASMRTSPLHNLYITSTALSPLHCPPSHTVAGGCCTRGGKAGG